MSTSLRGDPHELTQEEEVLLNHLLNKRKSNKPQEASSRTSVEEEVATQRTPVTSGISVKQHEDLNHDDIEPGQKNGLFPIYPAAHFFSPLPGDSPRTGQCFNQSRHI